MENLTNENKFGLLDIDIKEVCQDIRGKVSVLESCALSDDELNSIQNIIGDSIELDLDLEEPVENTRVSFYTKDGKVVVVKAKKLDVKRLFNLFRLSLEFMAGNELTKIGVTISILLELFFQFPDKDLSDVYVYLAHEYFDNGKKFNNIEIFDAVNQHLKSEGVRRSNEKIQEELKMLENDLHVIECVNGIYEVKDKIYFQ